MILYGTNPISWSNDDDWTIGDHLSLEDCLVKLLIGAVLLASLFGAAGAWCLQAFVLVPGDPKAPDAVGRYDHDQNGDTP